MSERLEAEAALKQANRAIKRGDLVSAERWSKTADRLATAAERVASLPPPPSSIEEDEEIRAELRRRLDRLLAAGQDLRNWEVEKAVYDALVAHGVTPPPLRPHPDDLASRVKHIMAGPEPEAPPTE